MRFLTTSTAALMAALAFSACSDNTENSVTGPKAQAPAAAARGPTRTGPISVPLTNVAVVDQATSQTGTFTGTLRITQFALNSANQLVASGLLTGTSTTGQTVTNQAVSNIPVAFDPQSCTILHLDLGPIFLNVLGLQLTTNEIVVDLTAVAGPGNLLGNLLCAVANLLNNNPLNLAGINNLLNQINQILAGLGL